LRGSADHFAQQVGIRHLLHSVFGLIILSVIGGSSVALASRNQIPQSSPPAKGLFERARAGDVALPSYIITSDTTGWYV
jgi:hypothetical protein